MIQIDDIVKADLCIGCGACISESQRSLKLEINEQGFYIPKRLFHLETDAAKVCPFNPFPDEAVEDEDKLANYFLKTTVKFDNNIGRFNNIYVGFANQFRTSSSSGGIGSYIMEQLLIKGIVSRLFVVAEIDGFYGYRWFDDAKQVKQASKTRYYPVTMERLFTEINDFNGKVAVSGVPAFLKAIRLKQYYYPELREKIPFLIGIICGGWKSTFYSDYLAQKAGIKHEYSHQEYRIKDESSDALNYSFGAYDKEDSQFRQVKMRAVGDTWGSGLFNANAYDFGDDFTAELSDISLGDAWLNPYKQDGRGTNVIITRSKIAEEIILSGIKDNELSLEELPLNKFKQSQAGGIRHLQKGIKFRLQIQKKQHGIVPHVRKRLQENIPFEYKLLQKQRMLTRQKSLEIWMLNRSAEIFDSIMFRYKKRIKQYTKFYHGIQKIKKMLKLKEL